MASPKARRTGGEKFRRIDPSPDQLETWFAVACKGAGLSVPAPATLTELIEFLKAFDPPASRKYKSETYGRQFLLELNREAGDLARAVAPPMSADALASMLNALQPGLGDDAVKDARIRIEKAQETIRQAGEATAAFLNALEKPFRQKKHPLWHHVALHIDHCAVLGWGGPAVAGSPTPDSPRVRFVASALSELGYLPPKKDAWDEDTISAVLSGKRGPGSNFPDDKKIQ